MKVKRLDRDKWGFTGFPYYQMRIDNDDFHGEAALIELISGKYYYWEMPLAGKIAVCGGGMVWLELIPDGKDRVITVKFLPEKDGKARRISVWYVDVIEQISADVDGVLSFTDKYLDVIFTTEGDIKTDDRDELDAALASGDITKEQYDAALVECDSIISELCSDIAATEKKSFRLLNTAYEQIKAGQIKLERYTDEESRRRRQAN